MLFWLVPSLALACTDSLGPWELDQTLVDPIWQSASCGVAARNDLAAICGLDDQGERVVSVFRHDSATDRWPLLQRIRARPGATEPRFGDALAMDGERLAIGGARTSSASATLPSGQRLGYVDLYQYRAEEGDTRFVYERTLSAFPDWSEVSGPDFGATLALDGSSLIVGARFSSAALGRAFVFDLRSDDPPVVLSEPTEGDAVLSDQRFGTVVDAASGRLAVSKPQLCSDAVAPLVCGGEVYVYHRAPAGEWVSLRLVSPEMPSESRSFYRDRFGVSVALGPHWLAVADDNPREGAPRVYLYGRRSGSEDWVYERSIDTSGVSRYGLTGRDAVLAIADTGGRKDSGAPARRIRIYRLSPLGTELESELALPSEFGSRIDVSRSTLIVSDSLAPASALVFQRGS